LDKLYRLFLRITDKKTAIRKKTSEIFNKTTELQL